MLFQAETRKQPESTRQQPERSNSEPFFPAELPKKRKSGKWLLAVVTGTGGGDASAGFPFSGGNEYPANSISNSPTPPGSIIPNYPPAYADLENNNYQNREYTDMTHAIPVSVGITVRKDFSRFFAAVHLPLFGTGERRNQPKRQTATSLSRSAS
jgi:hypothetical protein